MQTAPINSSHAFTGSFGSAQLADLIQMECSVMATRAVQIESGGKSGRIYFTRGQVVHAESGELSGEAALFEMLRWPGGHIVVADGVHPVAKTIDRQWQQLLRAAAPVNAHSSLPLKPRTFPGRKRR